jgi:nucleotide-binding universal stress UspA family protein
VYRNILAALDSSEIAARALSEAADLALALNAQLTIISVMPDLPGFAYRAGIDVKALEAEALAEVEARLREGVDSLPEGLPATTVLRRGNPGAEIVGQIERGEHDLIVMGSRGRGRVTSNLFGSVAAHVHFHSRVAMLVLQSDSADG